jgi:hypothetical protein
MFMKNNKFKIAVAIAAVFAAMVVYKVVFDKYELGKE